MLLPGVAGVRPHTGRLAGRSQRHVVERAAQYFSQAATYEQHMNNCDTLVARLKQCCAVSEPMEIDRRQCLKSVTYGCVHLYLCLSSNFSGPN